MTTRQPLKTGIDMQIADTKSNRLLAELKKKDELYHLCISFSGAGPLDGCCYATAKALQENIGGELYTMWGRNSGSDIKQGSHVLVKLGDQYWDGEGQHSEASIKELWKTEELLSDIDFKPFQEADVPDSPRDKKFVATLSHFFKSVMELYPEETARKRSIVYQLDKSLETDVVPMNAIAHLLKSKDWQSLTPMQINNGNSADFAYNLIELTGGELWETRLDGDMPAHMFIKWNDRFYDIQTPLGVQNWKHLPIFRPVVEIRQDHIDCHSGQTDWELWARINDELVGVLEYSEFEGVPKVTNIYMAREARRHGIATELVLNLQELYPDHAIEWNYSVTKAGSNFYAALPKENVPIEEVLSGQQQLAEVKSTLEDYARQAKELLEDGQPTSEQLEKHHQATANWNDLHDLHDDLEHNATKPTHKTMIDVPAIFEDEQPDPELTTTP